ncbi:retrovirus-related pol polyprotein from transposon TNT 1-94 [Tanacetum coccineum]|uniref:Retrovirus-related pol polyprotein from transposon TNT 1-94 n=1 Tax=Tanacetum coccineum TaxID=301880 RepID=A0ABQ5ISN1_9ASTR
MRTSQRVSISTRVNHPTSVSRPQLKSTRLNNRVLPTMGNDLLMGTRGSDLYTIELQESSSPTPICFMAKASSSQAWLWHRNLSYLNFDTISLLSKKNIVNGLPKLKYVKDDLCSSCELGKAKRINFKSKTIPRMIKRGLQAQVRTVRTDRGIEFLNKTLQNYFAKEGISHQTSIARTPEQNDVDKRWIVLSLRLLKQFVFNGENEVVSESFVVSDEQQHTTQSTPTTVDVEAPHLIIHTKPDPTTPTSQVNVEEKNIQADDA